MKIEPYTVKVNCINYPDAKKAQLEAAIALLGKGMVNRGDWLRAWNEGNCTHKITFDEPIRGNGMFNKKKWEDAFNSLTNEIAKRDKRINKMGDKIYKLECAPTPYVEFRDDIDQLKVEIDKLRYPMGRIMPYCVPAYRYANKFYPINICIGNITGFRKKGDYIEITWNECVNETDLKIYTKTFLLKDELIPLDATVDFGDIEFEVVE